MINIVINLRQNRFFAIIKLILFEIKLIYYNIKNSNCID